jgi:IS5 family transposase
VTVVIPLPVWKGDPERCGNRFRSRLEQIINIRHELVRLAGEINWQWIDTGLAGLIAGAGRPAVSVRFMVGLLLLKHIHGLSDEGVCARWVNDPNFQHFTGEAFFPHERSGLSPWNKRICDRLEITGRDPASGAPPPRR